MSEVFVSVTLSKEKLSSEAEKERQLLSGWLKKLKAQANKPENGNAVPSQPPRPPKGDQPTEVKDEPEGGEEIYDDVTDIEKENGI